VKKPVSGSVNLTVDINQFDARNILFFDRCGVFRKGNFIECHFGFYGQGRVLQQGLIALISQRVLTESKEGLRSWAKPNSVSYF
jgi:hypothetical protein